MARMTDGQKEDLLADWHTGQYSKNELSKKYKVSHTTVNKMTKGLEPKHSDKVSTISTMRAELAQESFKEVSAVETAIENRTKHLIYFQNSALNNQRMSNKAIESLEHDGREVNVDDLNVLETHSRITQRNKDTVLGKEPSTKIENTNAQQNNKVIKVEYD